MWLRLEDAVEAELQGPTVTGVHLQPPKFQPAEASENPEIWIPEGRHTNQDMLDAEEQEDNAALDDPDGVKVAPTQLNVGHYKILVEAITRAQARHVMETGVDLGELFSELLRVLLMLTESEYGFIGEVHHAENGDPYLRTYAITDISWNEGTRAFYREMSQGRPGVGLEFKNLNTLFGRCMTTGKAVISNDPYTDPRRGGLPAGHPPLNRFMGLPFHSGKTMVGMIGLANKKGGYTPDIVHFLKPFLSTCGNLITSARITQASNLATAQRKIAEERLEIAARAARIGLWFMQFEPADLDSVTSPTDTSNASPDLDSSIVYFSPELGSLLEDHHQEFRGPISDLLHARVHESDKPRWEFALREHFRRNSPLDLEIRLLTNPSGKYRWFQARGQVHRDEFGNPVRMAGSLIDVTQLVETREQALEANRVKSRFLAMMSHELRTPMTGILGMTSLALEMTDPALDTEHRELIYAAHDSATSLLHILDDLLDLSRIEAGKMDLQPHPFSIRRLVKDALVPFMAKAREKDLKMTFTISDEIQDRVFGDSTRLRQILVNLVGNALKFTKKGKISIAVDLPEPSTRPTDIRFIVEDTGIGIPQDKIGAVFEPFTQADGTMSRLFGGTGLGLSISRDLVNRMGGRLEVQSQEGKGSTFTFTAVLTPLATPGTPSINSEGTYDSGESQVSAAGGFFEPAGIKRAAVASESGTTPSPSPLGLARKATDPEPGAQPREHGALRPRTPSTLPLPNSNLQLPEGSTPPLPDTPREHKAAFLSEKKEGSSSKTKSSDKPAASIVVPPLEPQRSLRILLAEDNPVNQRLIERILQKVGHRVVSVANGRLAVNAYVASVGGSSALDSPSIVATSILPGDRLSGSLVDRMSSTLSQESIVEEPGRDTLENTFDLILMDVQMPELDGHAATRLIREYESSFAAVAESLPADSKRKTAYKRRIPIVALTANAMKGDEEICLAAGMDRFIPKPIDANRLKATIVELANDATFANYYDEDALMAAVS